MYWNQNHQRRRHLCPQVLLPSQIHCLLPNWDHRCHRTTKTQQHRVIAWVWHGWRMRWMKVKNLIARFLLRL